MTNVHNLHPKLAHCFLLPEEGLARIGKPELGKQVLRVRNTLELDLSRINRRKVLPDEVIVNVRGVKTHLPLALDVLDLVRALKQIRLTLGDQAGVSLAELENADLLAGELLARSARKAA